MRDYGRLYTSFFTSPTTRRLSDRGFRLGVYLLAGPHTNLIGSFYLPIGYICQDLGWDPEAVREGFAELSRNGFATVDESTDWVFVVNFLKWNKPENPNVAKAMVKAFEKVPDAFTAKSELAKQLTRQISRFSGCALEPFPNGSGNGSDTVIQPFRNPEPEPEPEPLPNPEPEPNRNLTISPEPAKPPTSGPVQLTSVGTSIAATENPDDPTVLTFPVTGDKSKPLWFLTASKLAQYRENFPHLDVLAEFRMARQWCFDNPGDQKTAKGMTRFLGGWLARKTDKPRGGTIRPPNPKSQVKSEYAINTLLNGIGGTQSVNNANF